MHSSPVDLPVSNTILTVGLIGNPNSGKSSVFNRLTGLRQKVGNFPGVTVEKKSASVQLSDDLQVDYIDFPGAYSLHPTSGDERVVTQTLANPDDPNYPDFLLYITDATQLEKHLLLFSQLHDLGIPLVLVLNMADRLEAEGMRIRTDFLSAQLGVPVLLVSARTGEGFDDIAQLLIQAQQYPAPSQPIYELSEEEIKLVQQSIGGGSGRTPYQQLLRIHHTDWLPFLSEQERQFIQTLRTEQAFNPLHHQVEETMTRYDTITPIVKRAVSRPKGQQSRSNRADALLMHPVIGPLIFFGLMFFVFQAIYLWAEAPMAAIEWLFGALGESVRSILPEGWVADLVVDGILAGLGGVLVFAPQIALLFFLIGILEEVGYMARAAFMFDRIMQSFGLNGRSMVALISGHACAIPAIMSARTISDPKERLLTIFVTPFTSCSARIPIYTVLIGFVVPETRVLGGFSLQGIAFMGLFLLGIVGALLTSLLFKYLLRSNTRSFLMLELPIYRWPSLRNVGLTVWEKVRTFMVEAGQIILLISIVLWALSSYGPPRAMQAAENRVDEWIATETIEADQRDRYLAAERLEASFAGHIGQAIEPIIRPLGYDWKMGIALLTSFAAREVFVGTMATIYSVGSADDEFAIRDRLAAEVNPATGQPVYNQATAASLLIFYVFAMMCMSTLAVVRRETGSWKWPVIQFVFMTAVAYGAAFLVYQSLG